MAWLRQWIADGAPAGAAAPAEQAAPTETPAAPAEPLSYEQIGPVLTETCGACHGDAKAKGLRVTDYASLMKGSDSGPVIVPGSPDESKIIAVLEGGHFARLTDEQMAWLRQWIADGAPETLE
jgi:mono/diheme cytochrome c family protein